MKSEADWTHQAKGLLKGELKRRNVSYQALSEALKAMGIEESSENIANKISRGKFTAVFFLQCMEAVGAKTLHLDGG
jgi:3-mercaptopyruvate sulfurtransferase SseA